MPQIVLFLPRLHQAQVKKCRRAVPPGNFKESVRGREAENWWNADLEGEMEKLTVEGAVTVAASGSKNQDREADHWQSSGASTKEARVKSEK